MSTPMEQIKHSFVIPESLSNMRLDQALHILLPEYSRGKIQEWIKSGFVTVNGKILKQRDKVKEGQELNICANIEIQETAKAQAIALNIVYEDEEILIINKPAGLVVHPGAGQKDKTLLNALLYYLPSLATIPRAGIVHRIDKDTSGLLVIAKTLSAHTKLIEDMQEHKIKREYEAIVYGTLTSGGTLEAPIGRHKIKRTAMAVTDSGKEAVTHYRIIERFNGFTHIKVNLETGRTHQIRVHMAHIYHPIVGDQTYGGRVKIPKDTGEKLRNYLQHFKRQALHAKKISLTHPKTGQIITAEAPLPDDMAMLLHLLRTNAHDVTHNQKSAQRRTFLRE